MEKVSMHTISFTALGTKWNVSIDKKVLNKATENTIRGFVVSFEKRFSRFLEGSEVSVWREAIQGTYSISEDLREMLVRAKALQAITSGRFDPAIGTLMEATGYDATYRLTPNEHIADIHIPQWSLEGNTISIDGPVVFDLGGIGKGYCIDRVGDLLLEKGFEHFIVEAGGDMYATTKADGSAYRVAIEYPGQPDMALGVVELRNQALAVSDSFRRRWGEWHHIIDPQKKRPIESIIGCAALGSSAFDADSGTSAIFLAHEGTYPKIQTLLNIEYLAMRPNQTLIRSKDWPGELFS